MNVLGTIKTAIFGVSEKEATFEVRGFQCPDPKLKKHLETVGIQFLFGYHTALTSTSHLQLIEQLNVVDDLYRGFSYEGAAMALMLLDKLNPSRSQTLKVLIEAYADEHIYMLHVGAGWALARLPFNLEKALEKFHPIYRWLVVDGYGFHQAYFKTDKYVHKAYIPPKFSEYTKHAFCQGVGRALWFVSGAQPQQAATFIEKFPGQYHGDLWSGIGLASTYAGGVDDDRIWEIHELGSSFQLHLAQGSVFGAKARLRAGNPVIHTEKALSILTGLNLDKASKLADNTLVGISPLEGVPAFEIWRQRIRNEIQEIQSNKHQNSVPNERIYS